MNIYMITMLILLLVGCLDVIFKQRWLVFVPALVLAGFAGFRSTNIGADTLAYYTDFWEKQSGIVFKSPFEIGYDSLVRTFVFLHFDARLFFFAFSTMTLLLLALFFSRNSYAPVFSLAYYYARFFLTRDMNQIRQSFAAVVLIFSFKYMADKNLKKFTAVVILASLFHITALIMFIPYFLVNYFGLKNSHNLGLKFIGLFVISVVVSFVITPLLQVFFSVTGLGSSYLTASIYVAGSGLLNPVLIGQSVISFILVYLILTRKITPFRQAIYKTYMTGTMILIVLNQYRVLAGRTSTILITIEALVVIDIIFTLVPKGLKTIVIITATILVFYLISGPLLNNIYLPYTTFLTEVVN